MVKEYKHINLIGDSITTLVTRDKKKDIEITGLTLCNVHESDTVYVDLFLRSRTKQKQEPILDWDLIPNVFVDLYIMKNIEITAMNTLILEPREIDYDSRVYDLMIQLNTASSKVDVMINFKKEK
jgi:hypothetical protein|tara:strand:+ start:803 stop:1177 length:375 start_codon:yes stop_codon:yes gene_type:complete